MRRSVEDYRTDAPSASELAAGAVLFRSGADEVVLLHHRGEDRWCFPKGHVEEGESIRDAAHREVLEETGLSEVRLLDEVGEVHYRFFDPRKHRNVLKTTVYWVAEVDHGELTPEPIFDRAEWLSHNAALARLHYDTDRAALQMAVDWRARHRNGEGL